jgi:hypothetical protein
MTRAAVRIRYGIVRRIAQLLPKWLVHSDADVIAGVCGKVNGKLGTWDVGRRDFLSVRVLKKSYVQAVQKYQDARRAKS